MRILEKSLGQKAIGSSKFSFKVFLEVKVEYDFQECRVIFNEIFEEYILSTKRFKTQ